MRYLFFRFECQENCMDVNEFGRFGRTDLGQQCGGEAEASYYFGTKITADLDVDTEVTWRIRKPLDFFCLRKVYSLASMQGC